MKTYLVDYENVKNKGLIGIEDLNAADEVIVLYSENANTITFETHDRINDSEANIILHEVDVGTLNALDFQLVTIIGFMIAKDVRHCNEFYIISKDTGYDSVIRFWHEQRNAVIKRYSSIKASITGIDDHTEQEQDSSDVSETDESDNNSSSVSTVEEIKSEIVSNRKTNSCPHKRDKVYNFTVRHLSSNLLGQADVIVDVLMKSRDKNDVNKFLQGSHVNTAKVFSDLDKTGLFNGKKKRLNWSVLR